MTHSIRFVRRTSQCAILLVRYPHNRAEYEVETVDGEVKRWRRRSYRREKWGHWYSSGAEGDALRMDVGAYYRDGGEDSA